MQLVDIYKALADESRLRILQVLNTGYFNVQELTAVLGISQSTVSHHLKILSQVGCLSSKREGTWAYYAFGTSDATKSTKADASALTLCRGFLDLASARVDLELEQLFREDEERVKLVLDRHRLQSQSFFDSVAKSWSALHENAGIKMNHALYVEALKLQISSDGDFLELGCGTGSLLDGVLPRAGKTIAVDYSRAMLDEAKRVLGTRAADVDFRLGFLEHLPLGDASVNCAAACMVFHHIASPRDALADVFRVLKPGGSLSVVDLTPHHNETMRERFADLWLGLDPEEFERWADSVGFKEVSVELLGESKEAFLFTCVKKI